MNYDAIDNAVEVFAEGDEIASALWFFPGQNLDPLQRQVEFDIFTRAMESGLHLGPIVIQVWPAEHQRLPDPPQRGMKCLVGFATVVGLAPATTSEGWAFLGSLSPPELEKLRAVTRKVGQGYNPGYRMSDEECDETIARAGPVAGEAALREAVSRQS